MKIKKLNFVILSSLSVLLSLSSTAQKPGNFTITGDAMGAQKIYLYKDHFGQKTDSVIPRNGTFKFVGKTDQISFATLAFNNGENGNTSYNDFFLEAGNIKFVKANKDNVYPSGTYDNDLIFKFETMPAARNAMIEVEKYYNAYNYGAGRKLSDLRKEENPDEKLIAIYEDSVKIINAHINQFMQDYEKRFFEFAKKYPKTYFTAAYLLKLRGGSDSSLFMNTYHNLGSEIQSSPLGLKLQDEIRGSQTLGDGIVAPVFTTTDINGNKISLSDFKGKYVLLDFWATWCGPCRAANPELIKIYNKYHDKGFEIIGIADDDKNIEGWKKAVKLDKTGIWHHVLRGSTSEGTKELLDLANLYKVGAYPTQYLIDKDGKIISTYDVANLESKLVELMP